MADVVHQSSGESAFECGGSDRLSASRIIQNIAAAVRDGRGVAVALSTAAQSFDHHDIRLHDESIESGALNSLVFAIRYTSRSINELLDPLGSTNEAKTAMIAAAAGISALEMVTSRCSEEALDRCIGRLGDDFLTTMAEVMNIFAAGDTESSIVRQLLLKNTTKVLLRVSDTVSFGALSTNTGLKTFLSILLRTLQCEAPVPACANCVTMLANLATQPQNRELMLNFTDLLDCLIAIIQSEISEKCTTEASRALLSLSLSTSNCAIMRGNDELQFTLLSKIAQYDSIVRSYAAKTLKNVICAKEKPFFYVNHRNAVLLVDSLVVGLQDLADDTRISCVYVLDHLLSGTDSVTKKNMNRSDLVLAVSILALGETNMLVRSPGRAINVLSNLADFYTFDDHETSSFKILATLATLSKVSNLDNTRLMVSEILNKLSRTPENKATMTLQSEGSVILSSLTSLVLSGHGSMCANAMECIRNLSSEESNRDMLCRDGNISHLLLGIASRSINVCDAVYSTCIEAIIYLVLHPPNRKRLSKYRHLIPALVAFAAKEMRPEIKEAAIDSIVLMSKTAFLI